MANRNLAVICIQRSEVPQYLHGSELYLSFTGSEEGDDQISVPSDCMKIDLILLNASDLNNLLTTMRFWILPVLPKELIDFLVNYYDSEVGEVLRRFNSEYNLASISLAMHNCDPHLRAKIAVQYDREDFVSYFIDEGLLESDLTVLHLAANLRRTKILRMLLHTFQTQGTPFEISEEVIRCVISAGSAECLQLIMDTNAVVVSVTHCAFAASLGTLSCLKYLLTHSAIRSYHIPLISCRMGHYDCLQYAVQAGCEVSEKVWGAAVSQVPTTALEILLTLPSTRWVLNETQFELALRWAGASMLRLLQAYNCPVPEPARAVDIAATAGNIEGLRFLSEPPLSYSCYGPSTMVTAIQYGHISLVQTLLQEENGVWDETAPIAALTYEKPDCLRIFLQLRGLPHHPEFKLSALNVKCVNCQAVLNEFS